MYSNKPFLLCIIASFFLVQCSDLPPPSAPINPQPNGPVGDVITCLKSDYKCLVDNATFIDLNNHNKTVPVAWLTIDGSGKLNSNKSVPTIKFTTNSLSFTSQGQSNFKAQLSNLNSTTQVGLSMGFPLNRLLLTGLLNVDNSEIALGIIEHAKIIDDSNTKQIQITKEYRQATETTPQVTMSVIDKETATRVQAASETSTTTTNLSSSSLSVTTSKAITLSINTTGDTSNTNSMVPAVNASAGTSPITSPSTTTKTWTIGGTATLNGATGLIVQNNSDSSDALTLNSDGTFTFSQKISHGRPYSVSITNSVTRYSCSVRNASGTATQNITNVSVNCVTQKKMFITNSTFNGNLGGIAGADNACENDSNKPDDNTYKAFILDGTNRVACTSNNCETNGTDEQIDWVLGANTRYVRNDGSTIIGETDSLGLLIFPLTNSFAEESVDFWDGVESNWKTNTFRTTNENSTCSRWTNGEYDPGNYTSSSGNTVTEFFEEGPDFEPIITHVPQTSYNAIYGTDGWACSNELHLLCVEQ